MKQNYKIIQEVCKSISNENIEHAKSLITNHYPFSLRKNEGRSYTEFQKTKIFMRDGFIDRYSGEKLIFPPVLRLLSNLMPNEFPFHKNWKMSECHIAYWQLLPTIDHIIPVSRGGKDSEANWVCTSQLRNSSKSNWLLEELGWSLHEKGDLNDWDGLLNWFIEYTKNNINILENKYINIWHSAVKNSTRNMIADQYQVSLLERKK